MANRSGIEWTEQTWNPTVGCTKVSPGCKNCYAETLARRLQAMGTPGYDDGFAFRILEHRLAQPLRRSKPTTYFVNSMSDLFHESAPRWLLDRVFDVIRSTPHHTYQILTKRADFLAEYFGAQTPPTNAWLGVSAEDRTYGVPRIDILRTVPAETRFVSAEPLLEHLGKLDLGGIHWVIVGGESGPKARPMDPAWVNSIKEQCEAQNVAFFFKQWGAFGPDGQRRTKKSNGRLFDGRTWDQYPVSPG